MKKEKALDETACRIFGCTDSKACFGGCWWVEDDLCSKCATLYCTVFYIVRLDDKGWIGQSKEDDISHHIVVTDPDHAALFITQNLATEALNTMRSLQNKLYKNAQLFKLFNENK